MNFGEGTVRDKYDPRDTYPIYGMIALSAIILGAFIWMQEKTYFDARETLDKSTRQVFVNKKSKNSIIVSSPVQTYHCFDDDGDGKTLERIVVYVSPTIRTENPARFSTAHTPATHPALFQDLNALYQESRQ